MINYNLSCLNGHHFEIWFNDAESCRDQIKAEYVACPKCDDKNVFRTDVPFYRPPKRQHSKFDLFVLKTLDRLIIWSKR